MAKNKEELEAENFALRAEVRKQKEAAVPADFEPNVELFHDPFATHNALRIIAEIEPCANFPMGQVLSWKSPHYRASKGWRGWIPLQWGDEYTGENGEKLAQYIAEVPQRMVEQEKQDSYVRRGDVLLARLDKRFWLSRQQERVDKSQRLRGKSHLTENVINRPGVQIVGEGLSQTEQGRDITPATSALNAKYPVLKPSEE